MNITSKTTLRTGSLLSLALAAFLAVPASADMIAYTASFNNLTDPVNQAASLSQFNPADGTLTSVTIELVNVYVTGTATVQNTTGSYNDYTISLSGFYKVADTFGDRVNVSLTTPSYSTLGNPNYPNGLAPGAPFSTPSETNASPGGSGMTVVLAANISKFIGTGTTSTLLTLTSANGVTVTGPAPYNTSESSVGSGTYEVIYTYTPVPEPGTTAAWMIAFVGCLVVGRNYFRRSSASSPTPMAA